jgi:hypothetical protein
MTGVIFQGNPKLFDVDSYLRRTRIRWLVNQHRDAISPSDTAFIWRADGGRKGSGGLVVVGRVLTPPVEMEDDVPVLWAETPRLRIATRVEIELDDVRLDPPSGMLIFRLANRTNFLLKPAHTDRLLFLWDSRRP